MVMLASYTAFGGGSIGNMLSQWEAAGIFTYALPFLLIFAVVYSLLSFIKVFQGNRAVNAVISLAVALMALQFQIVSIFFSEIFPRLGIALSVLLVIVILGALLLNKDGENDQKWIKWVMGIVTAIIIVVVLGSSFGSLGFGGWFGGGRFLYGVNWAGILIGAAIIGLIIWVVASSNKPQNNTTPPAKKDKG